MSNSEKTEFVKTAIRRCSGVCISLKGFWLLMCFSMFAGIIILLCIQSIVKIYREFMSNRDLLQSRYDPRQDLRLNSREPRNRNDDEYRYNEEWAPRHRHTGDRSYDAYE